MSQNLSLMTLFELGTHRGNSRSKMNPKLKNGIYGYNSGLCVIDLVKTLESIESVSEFLKKLGERKKQVLVVGTSDHIRNEVEDISKKFQPAQMPYVNYRWLGGTLTNWSTIRKTLKTLEKLNNIADNSEFFDKLTRNEQLNVLKQKARIGKFFNGLTSLHNNRPGAIIVLDGANNSIAIKEAELVKVPVILLTNTSIKTLPADLTKTILCNNHSTSAVKFIMNNLVSSYNEGFASYVDKSVNKVENTNKTEFYKNNK